MWWLRLFSHSPHSGFNETKWFFPVRLQNLQASDILCRVFNIEIYIIKIHPWRQSSVKTVDSDLRIYCYFILVRSGKIYGFHHKNACLIFRGSAILTMKLSFFCMKSWNTCTYPVYFKSTKELNYNGFVDPNILGASHRYRISLFLLDMSELEQKCREGGGGHCHLIYLTIPSSGGSHGPV